MCNSSYFALGLKPRIHSFLILNIALTISLGSLASPIDLGTSGSPELCMWALGRHTTWIPPAARPSNHLWTILLWQQAEG